MKFNLRLPLLAVLSSLYLVSCSSSNSADKPTSLKPSTTSVSGDLSDYLQVVDGDYQIAGKYIGDLAVKVRAIKPMETELGEARLSADFFTKEGTPIPGVNMTTINMDSGPKLVSLLKKGSGEEVITLSINGWSNEMAEKATTFSLSSSYAKSEPSSVSASSGGSSQSSSSTAGTEEYDRMLDEYERYVDASTGVMSGMDANDPAAMASSYADMAGSTMELTQKIEAAEKSGNMSPAQTKRFLQIQAKQVKAMSNSKMVKQPK